MQPEPLPRATLRTLLVAELPARAERAKLRSALRDAIKNALAERPVNPREVARLMVEHGRLR